MLTLQLKIDKFERLKDEVGSWTVRDSALAVNLIRDGFMRVVNKSCGDDLSLCGADK
jgi:hypothetical protein